MAKSVIDLGKRLWRDDSGQTTTEYIMILALVVMIAMKFKKEFVDKRMNGIIDSMGNNIDSVLQ